MPGKSSRRWASRFYHRRAARHDQGGRRAWPGRMRQHETAAFPPGLQAGGPQIGERGVGALPAGDEPGGGKPGFGPALERRQRLRLPDRGLPVVGGVAPPAHRARPGCRPASRGLRAAHQQGARGQRGQSCSTAHRASESWLGASAGGCRTVVFAPKPGSSRRPCALAGPTVAAITAGARKSRRARVSWSRYRRAALPLTKTTMS